MQTRCCRRKSCQWIPLPREAYQKATWQNNEKVYLNKQFYFRSDIVYTIPGKGDEMTVWDDNGKHKLQKYYLTMYLKEAYAIFLQSCENEDDKCSVSTFCNLNPKNVLLLGNSPKAVLFIWCMRSHTHMPAHTPLVWCV